jgi:cell division protease FtsH
MKLPIYNFTSHIFRVLSDRQFAEAPPKPGLRGRLADFIADIRRQYAEKKKKLSPNDTKYRPSTMWYFFATVLVVLLVQNFLGSSRVEVISYSQFKSLVKKDLINDLVIRETTIDGNLKGAAVNQILQPEKLKEISPDVLASKKPFPFETVRVEDPGLTAELETAKIPFKGEVTSNWLPTILSWVVPVGLFFLMWSYLGKKMGSGSGGLMQIGKSKAKVYIEKKTGVTFADVAGIDEAEEEVAEVVGFLKDPDKYQ